MGSPVDPPSAAAAMDYLLLLLGDPRLFISRIPPSYLVAAALVNITTALIGAYLFLHLVAQHPRPSTATERTYRTTTASGAPTSPQPLPVTSTYEPTLTLSVVVPAYNEHARLPAMLLEAVEFLSSAYKPKDWEILVVDDGSSDDTASVALRFAAESPLVEPGQMRVVVLERNRGKGGAVAHGMRHVRGRYVIFADADGASKFSDVAALMASVQGVEKKGYGIAVGSRAHMVNTDAVVKRSFVRNLLMHSFHTLLKTVGVREIQDTQCGFKLFSREAAKAVFEDLRTEGWIFDIEVLLLARYKGVPVVEVPVSWHEVEGTKLDLISDSIRMAWDLGVVRAGYAVGVYGVGPGGPGR